MKKFLLSVIAACSLNCAFAQNPYQDPLIIEDRYPSAMAWYNTKREFSASSANSLRKHYPATGTETEIHTYSWDEGPDGGIALSLNMAGFAVREIQPGTQIQSGVAGIIMEDHVNYFAAGPSDPSVYSVESTVLSDLDDPNKTYIAVTYYYGPYTSGGGKFVLHLYGWNSTSGLNDMGQTILSNPIGPIEKGIIHQDANAGDVAVITFEAGGRIYSQSLRIFGGTPKLSGLSSRPSKMAAMHTGLVI